MRTELFLVTLFVLLAPNVIAQGNGDDDNNNDTTSDVTISATASPSSTPTQIPSSLAAATTEEKTTETPTETPKSRPSSRAVSSADNPQRITTSTSSNSDGPLPTIPGQYSYPAPTVPPTQNAPFMQPSKVPEGTVFIAVGAILGAFGAAVLIWRAVVACLLHRSVKKAALAQQHANDKATFPPQQPPPFYKYTDQTSSASLGNGGSGRGVRRTTRGPISSQTPSQSNLFFSPTAPPTTGGGGGGGSSGGNRESRFLPSGFYAAGAGSPQDHVHSISLTNLRPDSHGHPRPLGYSPPDSPSLAPPPNPVQRNLSASSLNLNRPPSGRAPSTFLEDLLDDPKNQFPPPSHNQHPRGSSQSRY
ncbi:uncharacterized protein F4812DRAFT_370336 [Daldinia caldariorum]|uniref:uncharacterized protein n=1 Tax=Daldinia caldariorum TaxID=326644 RepID=UPI002007D8A2|nr:uncharacterized protein F4812DRAFT_370336 [Daldinia caldariorum]KAI1468478.1 hypothetical protein F4812DRAFT_370336 [Daldinia caldariorum]